MSVFQYMITIATLLAIFKSDNMIIQIACIIIAIFSFIYPRFKKSGKGNVTKNIIVFNQNKDKLDIKENGKNILNENKNSNKNDFFHYFVISLKKLKLYSKKALGIIYIKNLVLACLTTIWFFLILLIVDINFVITISFIPYCLLFFNIVNIAYLFTNKYNKLTNDKNTEYLKVSIIDIPFYIVIFACYWFLVNNGNNLSIIIIIFQVVVPMFLIILLQSITLIIFSKNQNFLDKYYSDYNFDV